MRKPTFLVRTGEGYYLQEVMDIFYVVKDKELATRFKKKDAAFASMVTGGTVVKMTPSLYP